MSKNRNLKYQFNNIINNNFKEGMNKHSIKQTGKTGSEVFSYSQRSNLLDVSSNFSNYMKETHPEIKQLKDINSNHVQEFLNNKKATCSQATLDNYRQSFNKLERLANSTYKTDVNWHDTASPTSLKNGGGKLRSDALSSENYNTLLKNSTNQNFKNALKLSQNFGLRASECSKLKYEDISDKGINVVDSKGGRSRFVPCETSTQKEVLSEFLDKSGRVCDCQTSSLQQAFNREKQKNGIESSSDFHACRKAYATQKFKEFREEGQEVEEALNNVSARLGHGENRQKLMRAYIVDDIK
jgi:site-specific recombinase XerD